MWRRIVAAGLRSGLLVAALWVPFSPPAAAPVRSDDVAAALALAGALAAGDVLEEAEAPTAAWTAARTASTEAAAVDHAPRNEETTLPPAAPGTAPRSAVAAEQPVVAGASHPPAAAASAESVAATFTAALAAHDADATLALLADGALIKEGPAVVAAGRERLHAWLATCLGRRFALDPAGRQSVLVAAGGPQASWTVSWRFSDSTGCYWRMRPGAETAPWPGPEVNPAEGRLTITGAQGGITSLTLVYSDEWRTRYLQSVAAPIRTAQAQEAQAAATVAAAATAVARAAQPHAPDTQGRTAPSVGPWLAALGLLALVGLMAAGRSGSH